MPLSYSDPKRLAAEAGYAHHARKPSSDSPVGRQSPAIRDSRPRTTNARSRQSSDLNQSSRHRTRNFLRSLRRAEKLRINTHNASEPSLSDLGAHARLRTPKQGLRHTRHTLPVRHQPDNGTGPVIGIQ